jgi:hypothetical protein
MAMDTIAGFKETVEAHGGPQLVVSLIFNNAYVKTFGTHEQFTYEANLDELNEYVIFKEEDPSGKHYTVVKPILYLEGIIFADTVEDYDRLDRRTIRG